MRPAVRRSASARRDFAVWLGPVPPRGSGGGKQKLGAVSKRGERTIRRLLISGASAVVRWASQRGVPHGSWLAGILARKPTMLVTRDGFAVLASGRSLRGGPGQQDGPRGQPFLTETAWASSPWARPPAEAGQNAPGPRPCPHRPARMRPDAGHAHRQAAGRSRLCQRAHRLAGGHRPAQPPPGCQHGPDNRRRAVAAGVLPRPRRRSPSASATRPNQRTGSSDRLPCCGPPGHSARTAASWIAYAPAAMTRCPQMTQDAASGLRRLHGSWSDGSDVGSGREAWGRPDARVCRPRSRRGHGDPIWPHSANPSDSARP